MTLANPITRQPDGSFKAGTVTIQHATHADMHDLEAFRQTIPGADIFSGGAQGWQNLEGDPPSWVAFEGGAVVGYMICHREANDPPNVIRIYCLIVDPSRMKDVGIDMIDSLISSEMVVGDQLIGVIDQRTPCQTLRGRWAADDCAINDRATKADIVWTKAHGWSPRVGNPGTALAATGGQGLFGA